MISNYLKNREVKTKMFIKLLLLNEFFPGCSEMKFVGNTWCRFGLSVEKKILSDITSLSVNFQSFGRLLE